MGLNKQSLSDFALESLHKNYPFVTSIHAHHSTPNDVKIIEIGFENNNHNHGSICVYNEEQLLQVCNFLQQLFYYPSQSLNVSNERDDLSFIEDHFDHIEKLKHVDVSLSIQVITKDGSHHYFPIASLTQTISNLYGKFIIDIYENEYHKAFIKVDKENDKLIIDSVFNKTISAWDESFLGSTVSIQSNKSHQQSICEELKARRDFQDFKHKNNTRELSPLLWLPILAEEAGEVAKEVTEITYMGKSTVDYREELLDTAAVCIAMIESIDRRNKNY